MQVDRTKWERTAIGRILVVFPGKMNEILQYATSQEIVRAQTHLSTILWRWYFLQTEIEDGSPYFFLEWRKEIEKWPKKGMFFPKAKLFMSKDEKRPIPKVQIDILVDFISFSEQPFLLDLKNLKNKKPLHYDFSQKYEEDLTAINKVLQQYDSQKCIELYFAYCILGWYHVDKLISQVFSHREWFSFWFAVIKEILRSGEKGLGMDDLIDRFVLKMRRKFPDYSILSKDLDDFGKRHFKRIEMKGRQWAQFWYDFSYFFLIPMSWHLSLLAPLFSSKQNFESDVHEVLTGYYEGQNPLHGPPNSLFFTTFGKEFFNSFKLEGSLYDLDDLSIN